MAPEWVIDESRYAGAEHVDPEQVARYDDKVPFDPSTELDILRELGLSADDTVVDFGAGTGVFTLAAAEHCDRVVAVDVSEPMLELVREKIEQADVHNVDVVHDGFVSYDHQGEPASFVYSKNTLHHLPDFWKVEALKTVGDTLQEGGIFRLRDLAYSFDPQDSHGSIEAWLDEMGSTMFTAEELHAHVREEFSTYGFLLESMLEAVGFEIIEAAYERDFYAKYICEWRSSPG